MARLGRAWRHDLDGGDAPRGAARRRALWPEVRSVIALGMSYAPDGDPLALADRPDRGRISVYAQGADYHDVVKKALKAARALAGRAKPAARGQGVRRHRAGDGKAARRGGRDRLAGQAHQSGQPRPRQLAVPRRDLHDAGAGAATRRTRALRQLHRLPRRLPDRRLSRAVPARCAALHLLPHDRA